MQHAFYFTRLSSAVAANQRHYWDWGQDSVGSYSCVVLVTLDLASSGRVGEGRGEVITWPTYDEEGVKCDEMPTFQEARR